MRNTHTRFEQVPVEIAEKVLELQHRFAKRLAKRDDSGKLMVRKSRRTHGRLRARFEKVQVST